MKKFWMMGLCLLFPLLSLNAQEQKKMDKRNLVVNEWKTDASGSRKELDHKTTFNANGKKVEEIEYNSDGQKWRKRFEYDASGKVSKEYVYDFRNRLQTYKTFEFNEFGKKKVQYTYNAKGKLISIKYYEYKTQ